MRVGIIILPDHRWSTARRRWQLAEEYGFDEAWTYDHLGWRDLVNGPWFDAVTTLTAAAQVTSRIRLGTMVASPNFRHPVHFARELTGLDDISDGRITLGVGAGAGNGSFDEYVLGWDELTRRDRVSRFGEFVELLDQILRADDNAGGSTDGSTDQEGVTWRGSWYTAVDARGNRVVYNGRDCRSSWRPTAPGRCGSPPVGQGWVTTGVRTDDLDTWWRQVAEAAARFDDVLASSGREPSSMERHLSLDAAPVFSLASVEAFADAVDGPASSASPTRTPTGRARAVGTPVTRPPWNGSPPRCCREFAPPACEVDLGQPDSRRTVTVEAPRVRAGRGPRPA